MRRRDWRAGLCRSLDECSLNKMKVESNFLSSCQLIAASTRDQRAEQEWMDERYRRRARRYRRADGRRAGRADIGAVPTTNGNAKWRAPGLHKILRRMPDAMANALRGTRLNGAGSGGMMTQHCMPASSRCEGGCQCGAVRYRITASPLHGLQLPLPRLPTRSSGATHIDVDAEPGGSISSIWAGRSVAFDKSADSGRTVRMLRLRRLRHQALERAARVDCDAGGEARHARRSRAGPCRSAISGPSSALPWVAISTRRRSISPGKPADRQPLYDAWTKATLG